MNTKAKKLILKSKKRVFGDMLGNNPSLFHGEGFEFAELREYIYGDDVRKIDWKTTAKLGKPFVKIYHEERELNVVVATMLHGATYFGIDRPKSEVISELVAILGFSAVSNGDRFSHSIYADKLYHFSKPSKKFFAVTSEVEKSLAFEPLGKRGDFGGWFDTLYRRVKKKSLLFLVSDFIGDIDMRLLSRKHDVFAVIVRDRFEESPRAMGYLRLVDMESGVDYEGDINESMIKRYKSAIKANDKNLYKHFRENGIRYAKVYTNEDPFIQLSKRLR